MYLLKIVQLFSILLWSGITFWMFQGPQLFLCCIYNFIVHFCISGYMYFLCRFWDPQPDYSAFREASYGHSTLEIRNRTHAFYHWNRNDDGKKVKTDSVLFYNQYWWVWSLSNSFSWNTFECKCSVSACLTWL